MTTRQYVLGVSCKSEDDFQSMLRRVVWLTYRCGFPRMSPHDVSDDAGWGCMLRSAQMLMANALLRHLAPEAMTWTEKRHRVLRWFSDSGGSEEVYSIHNLVKCGQTYDILPGEWYGPGIAAHVLRDLCECHRHKLDGPAISMVVTSAEQPLCIKGVLDKMVAVLAGGGSLSTPKEADDTDPMLHARYDPLLKLTQARKYACQDNDKATPVAKHRCPLKSSWDAALIVVIPLRLGLERMEAQYAPQLFRALQLRQSLGLIGGCPRQALFFPGTCHIDGIPHLVGFDPHKVQSALIRNCNLRTDSIECAVPKYMAPADLDPSLALGFYCRDRDDFLDLCDHARRLSSSAHNPIFCIIDAQLTRFDEAGECKHDYGGRGHLGDVESDADWEVI